MNRLINFLLFLVVVVTSSQVLTDYYPIFSIVDEIVLVVLTVICILTFAVRNNSRVKKIYFETAIQFALLILISLAINYYSLAAFIGKIFYYLKPLVAISVVSYLSKNYAVSKLYKYVVAFVILISIYGIIEYWAIIHHYNFSVSPLKYRNGIFRVSSITGHPISFGMMGFITFVYLYIYAKKYRILKILIIAVAIYLSGSRLPLALTAAFMVFRILDTRIKYEFTFKTIHLVIALMPILVVFGLLNMKAITSEVEQEATTTRYVAVTKGIEAIDNPLKLLIGLGIGSYGTYESIIHGSPVYEKIGFPANYRDLILKNTGSGMESFFFMAFFEMGLIGFLIYYYLLLGCKNVYNPIEIFLALSLIIYSLVYPIYTLPFFYLIMLFFPYLEVKGRNT